MAKKSKRYGNQNPTRSYILPYTKTYVDRALKRYEKSGRKAMPWQKKLLNDIYAVSDINGDELYTHSVFGYAVPRQNGKNEIIAIKELDALMEGKRVLHTAHRTSTSHAAWERLKRVLEEMGYEEKENYQQIKAIGREKLEIRETGGVVEYRTRTSTGGLGESYDCLIIDEAQEYTEVQQSALKYVISASDNPQTIMCGTPPTPYSAGAVFLNLRNDTLEGSSLNTGWAEWGVSELSDIYDRDLWYLTNPSLGYRLQERTIETELGEDEVDFNIQRLGLWLQYNQKSAISYKDWEKLEVENPPELVGDVFIGIKYGKDGENVAVSVAVEAKDGKIFIETLDCQSVRNGNGWILKLLNRIKWEDVVIDGINGAMILKEQMKQEGLKEPIIPKVKEIITANALFEQAIFNNEIERCEQPSLTQVTTNSDKRSIGSNGGFGYKSQKEDYEIALLDSVILAHWRCKTELNKPKQRKYIKYSN